MEKTETLQIRLAPELKTAVEDTFRSLGLSASEAVNIFFHQVLLHDGLPFAGDQRLYIVPTVDDTVAGYQIHSLDDPSIHGLYDLFTTLCDQTDWHVRLDWDELEYLDKSFPYRSLDSVEA